MTTGLRTQLALFALGGLGGALCDQLHTQLGVLQYAQPMILGQAWWVVPLFGSATIAVFALARPFARRAPPSLPRHAAYGSLWLLASYVASCFFFDHPYLVLAAFVAT